MLVIRPSSVPLFLRSLLPTEPHFPTSPDGWIFRGQGNDKWGLIPSIVRAKTWESLGGATRHGLGIDGDLVVSGARQLAAAEKEVIDALGEAVDQLGLPTELKSKDTLLAFAQHIGLPTRVLDWTFSPMIAAYFAAADAVLQPDAEELVVFGCSPQYISHSHRMKRVERLRVPGYGNPTLVAQQGLLLKLEGEPFDLAADLERREVQAGVALSDADANDVENHLLAITLTTEAAPELLKALRSQGIHAGTMFPGATGVGELVREVFRTSKRAHH